MSRIGACLNRIANGVPEVPFRLKNPKSYLQQGF
jgi:hypothetical protein